MRTVFLTCYQGDSLRRNPAWNERVLQSLHYSGIIGG